MQPPLFLNQLPTVRLAKERTGAARGSVLAVDNVWWRGHLRQSLAHFEEWRRFQSSIPQPIRVEGSVTSALQGLERQNLSEGCRIWLC
jgi:hypothetical protein